MLKAAFLDVGQGDTTVVWNPHTREAVVIDCIDPVAVWDLLAHHKVDRVRAVVVTHLHMDHFAGLVTFLEDSPDRGIDCDGVFFGWWGMDTRRSARLRNDADGHSQVGDDSPTTADKRRRSQLRRLSDWVRKPSNRERYRAPQRLTELSVEGMEIEFLHPLEADIGDLLLSGRLNNLSVVVRLSSGGGARLLLTGDLEPYGWRTLRQNASDLTADVLKFPHHGAWKDITTETNPADILEPVGPKVVIISVGTEGSKYDHPNGHVLDALAARTDITTLCTQATSKCCQDPMRCKPRVRAILSGPSASNRAATCTVGCPCASSVVLALDLEPAIVRPDRATHRQIVNECFPSARCNAHEDCISGGPRRRSRPR